MKALSLFILSLALMWIAPTRLQAQASELVIKDTAGVVRSVTQVEGPSNIEFAVADLAGQGADGAEIILKNEATGEELRGVSSAGVVIFNDVPPGVWIVASNTPNITFTSILVSASATLASSGAAGTAAVVLLGGSAVAGATVAIVEASDDDGDDVLSLIR